MKQPQYGGCKSLSDNFNMILLCFSNQLINLIYIYYSYNKPTGFLVLVSVKIELSWNSKTLLHTRNCPWCTDNKLMLKRVLLPMWHTVLNYKQGSQKILISAVCVQMLYEDCSIYVFQHMGAYKVSEKLCKLYMHISIQNTNAYKVLSESHKYFHLEAILVLSHLWSLCVPCMKDMNYLISNSVQSLNLNVT